MQKADKKSNIYLANNESCIFSAKVVISIMNTMMRRVHDMRDHRERWQLGTSYHKVMEDYLGVALIRSGRHRYRQMKMQRCIVSRNAAGAFLKKGGTA